MKKKGAQAPFFVLASHSIRRRFAQRANTARMDHDLIVVGASFAGAACALAAAQSGLRVCVLERKADPGDKLRTTGIIVKEAAERTLLGELPAHLTRRVERVQLYAPNLKQVALAAPGSYFLTTDTPGVMRWLADQLRANGVDLRLSTSFRAGSFAAGLVLLNYKHIAPLSIACAAELFH